MAPNRLNARQRRFVECVCAGMKKKDAAVAAGYSANTASAAASQLLGKEHVLQAIKAAAEKMLRAGAAQGAVVLTRLAESAKSEDVQYKAAKALLEHAGLQIVRQSEHRHVIEDRRSDAELLAHIRQLARELGVPITAPMLEGQVVDVTPASDAEPAEPRRVPDPFD